MYAATGTVHGDIRKMQRDTLPMYTGRAALRLVRATK